MSDILKVYSRHSYRLSGGFEEHILELSKDSVVFVSGRDFVVCRQLPQSQSIEIGASERFHASLCDGQLQIDVYYKEKKIPSQLYVTGEYSVNDYIESFVPSSKEEILPFITQALIIAIGAIGVSHTRGEIEKIIGVGDLEEYQIFVFIEASEQSVVVDSVFHVFLDYLFLDMVEILPVVKTINHNGMIGFVCKDRTYFFDSQKVKKCEIIDAGEVGEGSLWDD